MKIAPSAAEGVSSDRNPPRGGQPDTRVGAGVAVTGLIVLVVGLVLVVALGLTVRSVLLTLGWVALSCLAGMVLAGWLAPVAGWVAPVWGYVLITPARVAASAIAGDNSVVAWLVMLATLVLLVALRRLAPPRAALFRLPKVSVGPVATAVLVPLAVLVAHFRWVPRGGDAAGYYPTDVVFNIAVTGNALHTFPPSTPFVAGEPLPYHWLANVEAAAMAAATGTSAATVTTLLAPLVTMIVAMLSLYAALTTVATPWGASMATALSATMMTALGWDSASLILVDATSSWWMSPSFALSMSILPWAFLLVTRAERARSPQVILLLGGVGLLLGASKSSSLAVLVAAGGLWTLVRAVTRRPWLTPALQTGVLGLAFAVLAVVMFRGSADGVRLDPLAGMFERFSVLPGGRQEAIVMMVAVAVVTGGVLLIARAVQVAGRAEPIGLAACLFLTGIVIFLVARHRGGSELFFLLAVLPFGLAVSLARLRSVSPVLLALGALGLLTAFVTQSATRTVKLGSAETPTALVTPLLPGLLVVGVGLLAWMALRRRLGTSVTTVLGCLLVGATLATPARAILNMPETGMAKAAAAVSGPAIVSPAMLQVARQAAADTGPDAFIATDAHCQYPPGLDGHCRALSMWVSAFTGRDVLVEGWAFARRNLAIVEPGIFYTDNLFWDPERLSKNDQLVADPDGPLREWGCAQGVRYIIRTQPTLSGQPLSCPAG